MNFNKNNFRIDKDVAYFLGVLHSDGCIYFFNNKKENRKQIRLNLTIGKKSIPMALKFQRILSTHFNRTVNLRKVPNKEAYVIQTSINRLWYLFKNWKDQNIPREIKDSYRLFGVYLAGLIDGDVIIYFNGIDVNNIYDYMTALQNITSSAETTIRVNRDNSIIEMKIIPMKSKN